MCQQNVAAACTITCSVNSIAFSLLAVIVGLSVVSPRPTPNCQHKPRVLLYINVVIRHVYLRYRRDMYISSAWLFNLPKPHCHFQLITCETKSAVRSHHYLVSIRFRRSLTTAPHLLSRDGEHGNLNWVGEDSVDKGLIGLG
jgi:hypothetical protein